MLRKRLLFAVVVLAIGGILFGYNTGIIAGAMVFISREFQLAPAAIGVAVSSMLFGALLGTSIAGAIADRLGRRKTVIISAMCFIVGPLTATIAEGTTVFLLGRCITGIGVGVVSVIMPLYLGEIAPVTMRGSIVATYQLSITVGVLVAYLISLGFIEDKGWRWMIGIGVIPACVQMLGMLFLPESPRWLIGKHRGAQARHILDFLEISEDMPEESLDEAKYLWQVCKQKGMRIALTIGLGLSFFQQATGINAVVYYAPQIFSMIGSTSSTDAMLATVGVGTVNVCVTVCAVWILDRCGRRPLLLVGIMGMVLALGMISLGVMTGSSSIQSLSVFGLMAYIASFAIGLGPITWVCLSELYPLTIRSKAIGVATWVNWLINYLVALTFPDIVNLLGIGGAFLVFVFFGFVAWIFVFFFVPETKPR